ncbi:hypothetical protein J2N86_02085 [Legionella lytica]|uniref:Substrate of the Dot/Icm secretion system n=1 Tax=Legionella lytica TaxID=96232 RepID=A0ABY4Y930_9GAMM|nr:hypothetical protein [Legionella lytica]USQ14145.1 hypothetical protein J2N86_02085 [Legionella lytica]
MRKILAVVLILFSSFSANIAFAEQSASSRIPDEFFVREHWLSMTTSYDIETRTQKLGTLYRRFFSLLLTYDFYDPFDNKIAYARSKFFSFTAHFDVYDNFENYLGAADERLFSFFPTFDIYDRDGYTKLAKASMNFWGTTFTLYDPVTGKEMAHMSRPFFRLKNDWTFHVTDRELFEHKAIDPRVLMTVIAFQGDREYWEQERRQDDDYLRKGIKSSKETAPATDVSQQQLTTLLDKIAAVSKQEGLENTQEPDEKAAMTVAAELENGYNTQMTDDSVQSSQERLNAFTDYCLHLIQSNSVSQEKKKTILFLLKARLQANA